MNDIVTIRWANKNDIPAMMSLIKELALFEKAPNEVINTEERMLHEGFGEIPLFKAFVAEHNHSVIGLSIFYYRYSTWKGKCLYLEDLIVTEARRGEGIGKQLFEKTKEFAIARRKARPGLPSKEIIIIYGFYAPQGRILRYELARPNFIQTLHSFCNL